AARVHAFRRRSKKCSLLRTFAAWTLRRVHAVSTLDHPDIRRRGWTAWTTPVRVSSHVSVQADHSRTPNDFSSFLVAGGRARPEHSRVADGTPNVVFAVGRGKLLELGPTLARRDRCTRQRHRRRSCPRTARTECRRPRAHWMGAPRVLRNLANRNVGP